MSILKASTGSVIALVIYGATAMQAPAQSVLYTVKMLPLSLAVEAAETAVSTCAKQGFKVSANVVDRDGSVKAVLVGDGARRFTVDFSRRKAYTASIIGVSSAEFEKRLQGMPDGGKGLLAVDANLAAAGGGLPIVVNGEVLGALGISGAPSVDADEACAQSGIDRIKDRLK